MPAGHRILVIVHRGDGVVQSATSLQREASPLSSPNTRLYAHGKVFSASSFSDRCCTDIGRVRSPDNCLLRVFHFLSAVALVFRRWTRTRRRRVSSDSLPVTNSQRSATSPRPQRSSRVKEQTSHNLKRINLPESCLTPFSLESYAV